MKRTMLIMSTFGLILCAAGCVHKTHSRGSIVLKQSATEAYVCLGADEVKPGDKVSLFRNECSDVSRDISGPICKRMKVGNGEIIQNLNGHYSMMRVVPKTPLEEGMAVAR